MGWRLEDKVTDERARRARLLAEAVEQSTDLREAYERQQMLLRVSTAIRSELDLDAVLRIAVSEVGKAFSASRCAFYQADLGPMVKASHTYVAPEAPDGPFPAIDTHDNPYLKNIFAGQPVVIPDLHEDPYFSAHLGMRKIDTRSILAVSVIHQGVVLGSLSVHQAGRPRRWRDEEVTCFNIIADQLAMAICAAQQYAAARRKAQELERAYLELESVGRLKSDILATVSHELRTPLNDVVAYGTSIIDGVFGPVPAGIHGAVDRILAGGERLQAMVERMMDASRLSSGDLHIHMTDVEYANLVDHVIRRLRPLAAAKGLDLELVSPPDLPHAIADPERLERIIWHLIDNAIKFTPSGSITVRLYSEDREIITEISDTGIGIDSALQARVFEQFFQVDQGSTREYGGMGLGLYVAERFLAAMGCTIGLESTPGRGSTFRFSLALAH
ncbi:MAG: GAF domain-containing sensor histidine kinase [Candidatus Sericytochromatia bacterium]|uniref:histidine kinase n=1 Tax=Candidatus Tanganyikabacteria bacterium TaxID=2961651 RepID=A0A937X065_9BACT|nr:GAF domain-containing sensor histidine kinase [Candidatus Tanganyikabacteria bacterium]